MAVSVGLALLLAAMLPVVLGIDFIAWCLRHGRERAALAQLEARCPRGHVVALVGAWSCSSCPGTFEGHAWSACPHCGAVAHAIACPCGLSVVNPLSPVYA